MTLKGEFDSKINIEKIKEELSQLNKHIKQLSAELEDLIKRREALASDIAKHQIDPVIPSLILNAPLIHKDDSAETKASFLLDLFNPRHDIYATRGRNKNGKTVYYPKCKNLWETGCYRKVPDKSNIPCNECPMNEKAKLTTDVIIQGNFLNTNEYGRGAIGIYPLKANNTTRFVAIDLDEGDWESAARSILVTARNLGISMAAERSFSGNGAHLWIFFSEDVPAANARRLALLLIDKTREYDNSIGLESYDRLFPSQDILSGNGYGNLILLPLVASAVSRGCTLFLNENFEPYPLKEQITYLSALHRHSAAEVKTLIRTMEAEEFKLETPSEYQMNPSWNKWLPKLSPKDILSPIIIYLSTGISFDKKALSGKAQETIRRIGTISNPAYYKELAKHDGHYTGLNSRIPLFEENERVIKLPRGLYGQVVHIFKSINIPFSIEDHRTQGTGLIATLNKQLRPYQAEAIEKTHHTDCGIIAAATGSGKTIIALAIIAEKKERTLIIVNSKTLLEQWYSAIEESISLEIPTNLEERKRRCRNLQPTVIGTLEGSRGNRMNGIIDIAMLQSLSSRLENEGETIASRYGLIIVDECHHIAADKFRDVMKHMNAKYVYGLSATPKRADGLERIVYSECGNVLFTYDAAKLAYSRGIAQYFILRFLHTTIENSNKKISFTETLNAIADDEERNSTIADDITDSYNEGRSILVLTRRIEQNNKIGKQLTQRKVPNIILDSSMKQKEIQKILSELRSSDNRKVLIATDKLLGEGIDIPHLDTLFLASPFMQESAIQQFAGRISRETERKKDTLIYDYADFMIPRLGYMYIKRLSIYRKLGYVPLNNTEKPSMEMLFDDISFENTFISDVKKASKTIVISSTYIVLSTITNRILDALLEKSSKRTAITIICDNKKMEMPGYQTIKKKIENTGICIEETSTISNHAIFDGMICWYGDFSILGQSSKTQQSNIRRSMLRIINKDVAECFKRDFVK